MLSAAKFVAEIQTVLLKSLALPVTTAPIYSQVILKETNMYGYVNNPLLLKKAKIQLQPKTLLFSFLLNIEFNTEEQFPLFLYLFFWSVNFRENSSSR